MEAAYASVTASGRVWSQRAIGVLDAHARVVDTGRIGLATGKASTCRMG
jgi:hypothetical protein